MRIEHKGADTGERGYLVRVLLGGDLVNPPEEPGPCAWVIAQVMPDPTSRFGRVGDDEIRLRATENNSASGTTGTPCCPPEYGR